MTPVSCYAYGIKSLYGSANGEPFTLMDDGTIQLFKPYGYLHYFVDVDLQYQESVKDTPTVPEIQWIGGRVTVVLLGPHNYTISMNRSGA